jgi:surface antigen
LRLPDRTPHAGGAIQTPPYHGSVRPGRACGHAALVLAAILALGSGACSMSMELGSFLSDKKEETKFAEKPSKGDARDITGSLALQPAKSEKATGGIHPADWKLTTAALREALDQKDDAASIPWNNPDTGSRGTVTPVAAAYIKEGFACRNFISSHIGDGRESWIEGTACRIHRGEWEIRSARPLQKS